jgi:hypothetical protein
VPVSLAGKETPGQEGVPDGRKKGALFPGSGSLGGTVGPGCEGPDVGVAAWHTQAKVARCSLGESVGQAAGPSERWLAQHPGYTAWVLVCSVTRATWAGGFKPLCFSFPIFKGDLIAAPTS